MSKLVPLKMLKHHDRYNAGEVAGWPEDVAQQLIAKGVAKKFSKAEEAAEKAAAQAEAETLAARAADLDAREAALAAREAALTDVGGKGSDLPQQGQTKK